MTRFFNFISFMELYIEHTMFLILTSEDKYIGQICAWENKEK